MSLDKLVDSTQLDSDLTSVANAIRAKSGGSGQLAFPAGFVSEIGNIPSGGGGEYTAADFLDKTKPSGELTSSVVTMQTQWLSGRTGITKLYLPNWTGTSNKASLFTLMTGLEYAIFPAQTRLYNECLSGCSKMVGVELYAGYIGSLVFLSCSKLKYLVIRKDAVSSLSNVNSFNNTPFGSGGTGGVLYVPNDQISGYQSASNWSTILGYTNNQIKSIESTHTDPNAPVDLTTHYIDGTLIPTT